MFGCGIYFNNTMIQNKTHFKETIIISKTIPYHSKNYKNQRRVWWAQPAQISCYIIHQAILVISHTFPWDTPTLLTADL